MATINLADYDTKAVRAAVRKIKSCANTISEGTKSKIQAISKEIPEQLEGETATAFQQRMGDLSADVNTLVNSMNSLCRALSKYADDLERAARELQKQLS